MAFLDPRTRLLVLLSMTALMTALLQRRVEDEASIVARNRAEREQVLEESKNVWNESLHYPQEYASRFPYSSPAEGRFMSSLSYARHSIYSGPTFDSQREYQTVPGADTHADIQNVKGSECPTGYAIVAVLSDEIVCGKPRNSLACQEKKFESKFDHSDNWNELRLSCPTGAFLSSKLRDPDEAVYWARRYIQRFSCSCCSFLIPLSDDTKYSWMTRASLFLHERGIAVEMLSLSVISLTTMGAFVLLYRLLFPHLSVLLSLMHGALLHLLGNTQTSVKSLFKGVLGERRSQPSPHTTLAIPRAVPPPFPSTGIPVIPWADISSFLVENNFLGRGAAGEVYQGELHGEEVAIKVPYGRGLAMAHIDEFRREAQALDNLRPHPHVMPLKYVVAERTGVALIFPLARKLEDVCFELRKSANEDRKEENIVPRRVLQYMRDIARGLRHLHNQSLEHRDVKPANTFLLQDATTGKFRAVISDFGTAKMRMLQTLLSQNSSPLASGTVAYMPPEQAAMRKKRKYDVSTKSDIWAFGLTMNELMSGETPYEGDDVPDIEYLVRNEVAAGRHFPRACERLPENIQTLINSCFAFNPADRPSAHDLLETFSDMLHGTLEEIMGQTAPLP